MIEVRGELNSLSNAWRQPSLTNDFEKARYYSDQERSERENLRVLREKYKVDETATPVVTREDIEAVVAGWPSVPKGFYGDEFQSVLLMLHQLFQQGSRFR